MNERGTWGEPSREIDEVRDDKRRENPGKIGRESSLKTAKTGDPHCLGVSLSFKKTASGVDNIGFGSGIWDLEGREDFLFSLDMYEVDVQDLALLKFRWMRVVGRWWAR